MSQAAVRRRMIIVFGSSMLAAAAAHSLVPTTHLAETAGKLNLANDVPKSFGNWRVADNQIVSIVNPEQAATLDRLYSQVLSRIYKHTDGYLIFLAIAYGKDQREGMEVHYPEVCYPAQGFKIVGREAARLTAAGGTIPVWHLETAMGAERPEPVTYWVMVGDKAIDGGPRIKKLLEMRYTLRGFIPDGLLFRISSIDGDAITAFERQAEFAAALLSATRPEVRRRLAGV